MLEIIHDPFVAHNDRISSLTRSGLKCLLCRKCRLTLPQVARAMAEFANLGLVESNRRAMALAASSANRERSDSKAGAQAANEKAQVRRSTNQTPSACGPSFSLARSGC
jgi:hypothetical protein